MSLGLDLGIGAAFAAVFIGIGALGAHRHDARALATCQGEITALKGSYADERAQFDREAQAKVKGIRDEYETITADLRGKVADRDGLLAASQRRVRAATAADRARQLSAGASPACRSDGAIELSPADGDAALALAKDADDRLTACKNTLTAITR